MLPDGYGLLESDDGLLEWSAVEERLASSLHYWMATTSTLSQGRGNPPRLEV
jgi:hypothetical protein